MKQTKIIFGIAIFMSWAILAALFTVGFENSENTANDKKITGAMLGTDSNIIPALAEGANDAAINASEVSIHNSASSCWFIIDGKVYDVTKYLPLHPGGPGTITPYCGKDATNAFATKDTGRPHSQSAADMLAEYYVGDLKTGVNLTNTPQNSAKNTQSTSMPKPPAKTVAQDNTKTPAAVLTATQPVSPPSPALPTTYSLAEISAHNSASSCWATMNGNVYDITAYLPYHPGGISAITPYCGGDLTAAFTGLPHSQNAATLLASYYIGVVGTALPPPHPPSGNLTLSITANQTAVTAGTTEYVSFTVIGNGTIINNAAVTLSGAGTSASGTTNANGIAVIRVRATTAGTITATASMPSYESGNTTLAANAPQGWWEDD